MVGAQHSQKVYLLLGCLFLEGTPLPVWSRNRIQVHFARTAMIIGVHSQQLFKKKEEDYLAHLRAKLIIYRKSIILFWGFWESAVVCCDRRCVDVRILLQITLMSSLVRLDHTGSVQSMALVCIVRLVCFHSCSVLLRALCLTSHQHQT